MPKKPAPSIPSVVAPSTASGDVDFCRRPACKLDVTTFDSGHLRPGNDRLVDLPLTIRAYEISHRETKTGELKLHLTDPTFANCPWLVDNPAARLDPRFAYHVPEPAGGRPPLYVSLGFGTPLWFIEAFDQDAADEFAYRQTASAPSGTPVPYPVVRSVQKWARNSNHTAHDPNLNHKERLFDGVVRSKGLSRRDTSAAIRWNQAHDELLRQAEMLRAVECDTENPDVAELAKHVKKNLCLRFNTRAVEIEALRKSYNEWSLTSTPDGSNFDIQYSDEALEMSCRKDWEAECQEADKLYRSVISKALEQSANDPNYIEWLRIWEWVKRPKNRGEKQPPSPLPLSDEATWIGEIWHWGCNIFEPKEPRVCAEPVLVRRNRRGEHHEGAAGPFDVLFAVPPSESFSGVGYALDRSAESYADGTTSDAYGDHDDEPVEAFIEGDYIEHRGRETTKSIDPEALKADLVEKYNQGSLTNEDLIDYITELRNIPDAHAAAILQEENVNTLTKRLSRNRQRTKKIVTNVCGENLCDGYCKRVTDVFNSLRREEAEKIFAEGGWFVLVKLDRQSDSLRPINIERFRAQADTDDERSNLAFEELRSRTTREAIRKAMPKAQDENHGGVKAYEFNRRLRRAIVQRIEDAFDRAEIIHFRQRSRAKWYVGHVFR